MIITPDFLEHYKTRALIDLTGDKSTPLCLLRLWGHCQQAKRAEFPNMTREQLASVCHWDNRKPAAHIALVRAGFVEKLKPKGFAAHDWSHWNAQLIQKWEAGKFGGRPAATENANRINENEKPTDNRPPTGRKPIDQIDQTDQRDLKEKTDQTDQTPAVVAPPKPQNDPPASGTVGENFFKGNLDGRTGGLDGLASKRALTFAIPDERTVFNYLNCLFNGAGQYAKPFLKAMKESGWKSKKDGRQVQDWKAIAKEYANAAARNQLSK